MISWGFIGALVLGLEASLSGIYSSDRDGVLYGVTRDAVYTVQGKVFKRMAALKTEETFIGTDADRRPLAMVNGFIRLNPLVSPLFDDTGSRVTWDYSRELIGVRAGVIFTSVGEEVHVDLRSGPQAFGKAIQYTFRSKLRPFSASVSPDRSMAAVCLSDRFSTSVSLVDLKTGATRDVPMPNIRARILQVEFRDNEKLLVLSGELPSIPGTDMPEPKKLEFAGHLYELSVSSKQIKKIRTIPMLRRTDYLANIRGRTVAVLAAKGIIEVK